ncbi:UNVERIFIED_CONTAM: ATPase family AAA domain-containing protein 3 [Sesamum radiatum]|uniref:ATPase family AAA domain-containing protein 3 n=1 Tax=Sesamum radiatum TaxID=300843 RepID=A0AAW2RE10_SESRA
MAASRLSSLAAAAAIAASYSATANRAYADAPFRFYPFSSAPSSSAPPEPTPADTSGSDTRPAVEVSKGGFDPESLERGAKALREINSSPHAKQVFEVMRKQEQSRLAELDAEKANFEAIQAHADIEKQRKWAEDQRNLYQQQAQAKAQMLRYEDELARKRMQTDHEAQRRHNTELVQMQEESSIRKEQARRATEEQIQAQQRQTEKERAEIERETIRVKAMAEAEGRAHEAKLTEEHNRRMLLERINGEREKWLAAINTTFSHIEGGVRVLLTDRSKLVMTVGGATALAAGVYTTREGARVMWGYINRILGQPSLIRESSMAKFPWSGLGSRASKVLNFSTAAGASAPAQSKSALGDIVLHPSLQKRIEHLARATSNTKTHQAPFRNMLFYGPPGTGKTMVAREIARKSGLDYAMMTGGDVAPLGPQAVTKIHEIFDWAKKSKKGLLLFIDEADAFLCERNSTHMSEAQRSALNALLFRTGDQSRDVVLVLATNRPGDLDSAVTDRIDEVIEFPLPQEDERFKLLKLYLSKYLCGSVQAAVYGRPDCVLDSNLFKEIVDYKVAEHHQRIKLASEA